MVRAALETGTLDLEGRGLTLLAVGLFSDERALSAVKRAKLSGNKLQVCKDTFFVNVWYKFFLCLVYF